MTIDVNPEITGSPHFGDFFYEVSRGAFAGQQDGINYSGYQTANSIGVEADIWSGVVGNITWLTANTSIEILSDSVNDTSAGTGARTVTISGLNIALQPISETVSLNGTTPVQLVNQYFRVLRGFVASTGTYNGTNIGNITVRVTAAGSTQGVIPAGNGRIAKTHYTVPAGKVFLLRSINMTSEATKATGFKMYIKGALPVTAPFATKQLGLYYPGVSGPYEETFIHEVRLGAGTDIWATATPSTNNTNLSLDFQGVEIAV